MAEHTTRAAHFSRHAPLDQESLRQAYPIRKCLTQFMLVISALHCVYRICGISYLGTNLWSSNCLPLKFYCFIALLIHPLLFVGLHLRDRRFIWPLLLTTIAGLAIVLHSNCPDKDYPWVTFVQIDVLVAALNQFLWYYMMLFPVNKGLIGHLF